MGMRLITAFMPCTVAAFCTVLGMKPAAESRSMPAEPPMVLPTLVAKDTQEYMVPSTLCEVRTCTSSMISATIGPLQKLTQLPAPRSNRVQWVHKDLHEGLQQASSVFESEDEVRKIQHDTLSHFKDR